MAFDAGILDQIRAAISVSDVVGRRFNLVKQGNEFVVADNSSFTVNDKKQFWKEFGNGGTEKPGDIFDFLVKYEGYDFVGAVKELAAQAGIRLPEGPGRSPASSNRSQNASSSAARSDSGNGSGSSSAGDDRPAAGARANDSRGKKEIVAEWNIYSPSNELLYQVVRMQERLPDGSWRKNKEGKTWKNFMQRRPSPDGDGAWLMGLNVIDEDGQPYEFMKLRTGWIRFNQENFEKWKLTERKSWPDASNVGHWFYNANAVSDQMSEPAEDQRTIFLPEGEAKVDVLTEWDLLAVTNTGGAGNFTPEHAEFFRGAADVVILSDNDRAGQERVAKIAPMLRAVGANVRSLNFRDVWSQCPPKGDIKNWRDEGGGTREALLEIVDGLKPWTPEPYKSKFGAKTGADLAAPVKPYPWRVKGIIPMHDTLLIDGPSRSGKTFEVVDMAMHICMEKPTFAGRKVVPCGVIYLAYEGVSGFENRIRAYLQHHGYKQTDLHSFAWLTRPPNLFSDEGKIEDLVQELNELAAGFKLPLGIVIVDTHNASTRGASEVKSDEIGRIMNHHDIIAERTGATPWIIGHTNSEGKHRGNEQFFNRIEASLRIERVHEKPGDPKSPEKRDDNNRVIRRARVMKQRDGSDEIRWDFVLQQLSLGVDADGDDIPGFVSVEPAVHVPDEVLDTSRNNRPEGFYLRGHHVDVFKALLKAVQGPKGIIPPSDLDTHPNVPHIVRWGEVAVEYKRTVPQEDGETLTVYANRVKGRINRFKEDLLRYNVVGVGSMRDPEDKKENPDSDKPKMIHYIWPTGKRVFGKGLQWPPQAPKKKEDTSPIIDQATGQPLTDMDDTGPVF